MDDLTSGFNIGTNYTNHPEFNGMVGFDEEEVREMFDYYLASDVFPDTAEDLIQMMKPWYDSNCFAFECLGKPTMFNSDMTLYFLFNYMDYKAPPRDMLDANMRSDYNKLRMLMRKDQGFGANSSTVPARRSRPRCKDASSSSSTSSIEAWKWLRLTGFCNCF